MKKSLRLSALGLSTALAISGLAVVQPTVAGFQPAATASADETTGGMPRNIFKDSDNVDYRYDDAFNTFDTLYKARSFYAAAFREITGYTYYDVRKNYTVFAEMEDGARGVTILQALDYQIPENDGGTTAPALAARDIDLSKIGTDEPTRRNALRLLEHAVKAYEATKDEDEVIGARYAFINQSKSGMHNYVNRVMYRTSPFVVLNLGLEDADLEGISPANEYDETFTLADAQKVTVLKIEDHAFPGTDQAEAVNANGETNAAALEEEFGSLVPAPVDPQAAFDEVNAILLDVNELVDTYQYEGENTDMAELSSIEGASDNLLTEIKALRESDDGQGILEKKADAQALKDRVDAVVAATINKLKEKLKESATASQTAAQELKDDAKKTELGDQATSLLDEIGAAEDYDALKKLEEKAAALAKAIAEAKDAEPADNGNGDGTNDDNGDGDGDGTNDDNGNGTNDDNGNGTNDDNGNGTNDDNGNGDDNNDDNGNGQDDGNNDGDGNGQDDGNNDGDDKDGSSDKLDAGAIAGIVIGILALLGAILGGIFHFFPQLRAMLPRF